MKLYLSHPIKGLSGKVVFEYYDTAISLIDKSIQVLSPMTSKEFMRADVIFRGKYKDGGHPLVTNHALKERDQWMVGLADIVLVDLSETKLASIGCCMELAWADLLGKHTVVVVESGSVHDHAFVLDCADVVFSTFIEAIHYINTLSNNSMYQYSK
jgi:hypothetical protein